MFSMGLINPSTNYKVGKQQVQQRCRLVDLFRTVLKKFSGGERSFQPKKQLRTNYIHSMDGTL